MTTVPRTQREEVKQDNNFFYIYYPPGNSESILGWRGLVLLKTSGGL